MEPQGPGSRPAIHRAPDLTITHPDELAAACPDWSSSARNPFALRVRVSYQGVSHPLGLVPDLVFGLRFNDGSRRCFMVEIDRGTMPVTRTNLAQTSFERKMRLYLNAHAAKQHERQFGWKTFRVLTVTTDEVRAASMMQALRRLYVPGSPGAALFFFAIRDEMAATDPLAHIGRDGVGRDACLV